MKITETHIQSQIIYWAMHFGGYKLVLPNSNTFVPWEADILAVSRSLKLSEYEIKISKADYKRDEKKIKKHQALRAAYSTRWAIPNYFCYVTFGFDIEPPTHAGWIRVDIEDLPTGNKKLISSFRKPAPILHKNKLDNETMAKMGQLLSFRYANLINQFYPSYIKDDKKDSQ